MVDTGSTVQKKNNSQNQHIDEYYTLKGLQGYPSPKTMHEISNLIEDLIKESKVSERFLRTNANAILFSDIEDLYLSPGIDRQDKNVYMFSSAAMLSKALSEMKDIYYLENIKFNPENIMSDKRIDTILPESLTEKGNFHLGGEFNPPELLKLAGEQLLQGIETEVVLLGSYYDKYTGMGYETPELKEFVNERAQAMSKYAKYSHKLADIFEQLHNPIHASHMRSATFFLKNPTDIVQKIEISEEYQLYDALLRSHATMAEVPESSGLWNIIGQHTGEEVSALLKLQHSLLEARNVLDHARHNPKMINSMVSTGGYILERAKNKNILGALKKQGEEILIGLEAYTVNKDEALTGKGTLVNLEDKITCPGLSYGTLKIIGEFLDNVVNDRTVPVHKKFSNTKEIYDSIKNKNKEYIGAVRALVKETVGKWPKPLRYKFGDTEDIVKTAPGVAPIIYRSKTHSNGELERIQELWGREAEDVVLKRTKSIFPNDDIYVRTNQGVAFMSDISATIGMINSKSTLINVRDVFSTLKTKDKLAKSLLRLHVDAHEIVHSAQSDSRLSWRSLSTSVMEWALSLATIAYHNGQLDRTVPDWGSLSHKLHYQKTWRESIQNLAECYIRPALGNDEYAAQMREYGPFEAMYNFKNITPINIDGINVKKLRKVPLEKGVTSSLVRKAMRVLKKGSIDDIMKVRSELKEHDEELTSITEHMAEAFSLVAVKKYLNNHPDKRYTKEKLDEYSKRVERNLGARGILATKYQDALVKSKSIDERTKLLREYGMKYTPHFSSYEENIVENRLIDLGYDALNPYDAYENMTELKKRAKEAQMSFSKVLTPMNGSKAIIGLRYDTGLDDYEAIIDGLGAHKAFERLLNAESAKEVKELAAMYKKSASSEPQDIVSYD